MRYFFELHAFPLGGIDLALTLLAGFLVMLVLLHLGDDASFFTGLLEPFQGFLEGFLVSYNDSWHAAWPNPLQVLR